VVTGGKVLLVPLVGGWTPRRKESSSTSCTWGKKREVLHYILSRGGKKGEGHGLRWERGGAVNVIVWPEKA